MRLSLFFRRLVYDSRCFSDTEFATFAVAICDSRCFSDAKFATFAVFFDTEFATLVRDLRIWNV